MVTIPQFSPESMPALDQLELSILRALHEDGRASWGKIAEEVGSSTSTVRRRFETLQSEGLIRVIGRTDVAKIGAGIPSIVRFQGRESSHQDLLRYLKQREDVRYLAAVIGSAGSLAEIVTPSLTQLQNTIETISSQFDVTAEPFVVTHTFTSGQDWMPDSAQRYVEFESTPGELMLSREESLVLGLLLQDGRASLSDLSNVVQKSESTIRRIIDTLIDHNILSFRVLVEPETLGFKTEFWAWLDIEPSTQATVGEILAVEEATKTLVSTTGRYNLLGQFVLPRHTDLHHFETKVLGALPGVRSVELMLDAGTLKRVWNEIENHRYGAVTGPEWLFGPRLVPQGMPIQ